jgi:hypothetical protein
LQPQEGFASGRAAPAHEGRERAGTALNLGVLRPECLDADGS